MEFEYFNSFHTDELRAFIKRKDIKIKHICCADCAGVAKYFVFYKKKLLWRLFKRKRDKR